MFEMEAEPLGGAGQTLEAVVTSAQRVAMAWLKDRGCQARKGGKETPEFPDTIYILAPNGTVRYGVHKGQPSGRKDAVRKALEIVPDARGVVLLYDVFVRGKLDGRNEEMEIAGIVTVAQGVTDVEPKVDIIPYYFPDVTETLAGEKVFFGRPAPGSESVIDKLKEDNNFAECFPVGVEH
jgi:hypothetical protein